MTEKLKNFLDKKLVKILAAVFCVLITASITIYISGALFEKKYQGRIYPGVFCGEFDLSGKTIQEASSLLLNKTRVIENQGIIFESDSAKATLPSFEASFDAGIAHEIFYFKPKETANFAYNYGRSDGFFKNWKNKIIASWQGANINMGFFLDEKLTREFLNRNFSSLETPTKNSSLEYANNQFTLTDEKTGPAIDYNTAINSLKNNLSKILNKKITVSTITAQPEITKQDNEKAKIIAQAEKLLALAPIELSYQDKNWIINKNILATLLTSKKQQDKIIIGINEEAFDKYLEKNIAPEVNIEAKSAKFKMENGKVSEFQKEQNGRKINTPSTITAIEKALAENNNKIELIVDETKNDISAEAPNDFGIKDLLGVGESNFAGSPQNRRHNIATGASAVSGILIKPNEEFSLIATLGDITAETGYLPELVIKENRTVPEYGGGLCQIGTTVFRAALSSGLPITMRRNHSYRVSYYEPAGTDATIYDPLPDLRFLNDTGNYILIQKKIVGDKLSFEFWGTNDGRKVDKTEPTIYNIVPPAPTKIVETDSLKPGEKKCTESAHAGADAFFDYKVTYPDGQIKSERFSSHYVPWQAVCLVGKSATSTATSTSTSAIPTAASSTSASTTTPAN